MEERTPDTPWRQGQLLTEEARTALGLLNSESPSETAVIVATHDCDLVQSSEREPSVEVLVGRWINRPDGNSIHGKSARTLHLRFADQDASPRWAEFVASAKLSVEKDRLQAFTPLETLALDVESKVTFQRWLAARYQRAAFPDEFERRIVHQTKLADRIAKAVRQHGETIAAVLFDVSDEQSGDVYELGIVLLYEPSPDQSDEARKKAVEAATAIRADFETKLFDKAIDTWRLIKLGYIETMSTEALSYQQYTMMRRWRLDHVSLSAEPQHPVPAE